MEYNNFARGGRKPQDAVSATRSALSQYEHFAKKNQRLREIASDLGNRYGSSADYRVHIWTRKSSLKAYEPNAEPNPLV